MILHTKIHYGRINEGVRTPTPDGTGDGRRPQWRRKVGQQVLTTIDWLGDGLGPSTDHCAQNLGALQYLPYMPSKVAEAALLLLFLNLWLLDSRSPSWILSTLRTIYKHFVYFVFYSRASRLWIILMAIALWFDFRLAGKTKAQNPKYPRRLSFWTRSMSPPPPLTLKTADRAPRHSTVYLRDTHMCIFATLSAVRAAAPRNGKIMTQFSGGKSDFKGCNWVCSCNGFNWFIRQVVLWLKAPAAIWQKKRIWRLKWGSRNSRNRGNQRNK